MKLVDVLAKFFGRDWGMTHLKHGKHKFFVPTKIVPTGAWIKLIDFGGMGCGNSPRNTVSYKLMESGIDFEVDVQSDRCRLEWFATK